MGKDKNINIITRSAKKIIEKNNLKIKLDIIYNHNQPAELINTLINTKTKKITIYDTTYKKTKNKTFKVNDHINKTGKNPLVGNQKKLNIDFIDISKIYKQTKGGIITTSYGKEATQKKLSKLKNPSTETSNIAILCKVAGYKKIEAKLLNSFYFS